MTITLSPLYILFGIEAIILIIIFAIVMAIGRQKYKNLYNKLLNKQKVTKLAPDYKVKDKDELPSNKNQEETSKVLEQKQDIYEEITSYNKTEAEDDSSENKQSSQEEDPFSFRPIKNESVNQLKKVVDFQKEKIINLMCYKNILESAQKKLMSIHDDYTDLEQRFIAIQSEMAENKEYELALNMFGDNTKELQDFIDTLQKENEQLLEKFNSWEGQLKDIWNESDSIESETVDIATLMTEKEEMMEKIKEFEEKIKEKTKQLQEAQTQYENLENEYMILYRKQQASEIQNA